MMSGFLLFTITHTQAADLPEFEVEVDIHSGAEKAVLELADQWSKAAASPDTSDCRVWAFSVSEKAVAWASIRSGLIEVGRDFAAAIGDVGKMANMKGLEKASKLAGGIIDSMLAEDPYQQLAHAVAEAAGDFFGGRTGDKGAERLTHGRVGEGAGEAGEQLGKALAARLFPSSPKSNTYSPLINPWGVTVTYDFVWPVGAKRGGLRITVHGDCHGEFPPNQPEAARLGEFYVTGFLPLEGIEASVERERDPVNIKGLVEAGFDVIGGEAKRMDLSSGPTAAFLASKMQFTLKFTAKWGKFSQDDVNVYAPCVGSLPKDSPTPPLDATPNGDIAARPVAERICEQRCSERWTAMSHAHFAFWEAEQKMSGLRADASKAKRKLLDGESAMNNAAAKWRAADQDFRDRISTAEKEQMRARNSANADSGAAVAEYSRIIAGIKVKYDLYIKENRGALQNLQRTVEAASAQFEMIDKLATGAETAAKAAELTYSEAKLAYEECVKRCNDQARLESQPNSGQLDAQTFEFDETLRLNGQIWSVQHLRVTMSPFYVVGNDGTVKVLLHAPYHPDGSFNVVVTTIQGPDTEYGEPFRRYVSRYWASYPEQIGCQVTARYDDGQVVTAAYSYPQDVTLTPRVGAHRLMGIDVVYDGAYTFKGTVSWKTNIPLP